jgi:mannose-6-phosphate isomerase-like protein (cupin superfamily)
MDPEEIKSRIVTNFYHITSGKKVALHKHSRHDEVFYCMMGEGFGVLEDNEVRLSYGKTFTVPSGTMHALRTDGDLWVASFLIPVLEIP